jgi:hypothetical protein
MMFVVLIGVPEITVRTDPQLLVIALTMGRSDGHHWPTATRDETKSLRACEGP